MNIQEQVLLVLKPKVASLGFDKNEIGRIAASLAGNLSFDENASEEVVSAGINEAIDNIIPILQVGQSFSNRILDGYKASHKEPEPSPSSQNRDKDADKNNPQESEMAKMFKQMQEQIQSLHGELNKLNAKNLTTSRKAQVEALVKDKGTFGSRIVKSFEKMIFDNDDDFEAFLADVKQDITSYDKELGESNLSTLGNHPNPQQKTTEQKLTDKEIEDVVAQFS